MNRDRRKVVANIFADAAKYVLTAGIIGFMLAEKMSAFFGFVMFLLFGVLILMAYFVTPKDLQ